MNYVYRYWLIINTMTLSACSTTFSETHYFQSLDANGKPTNYYRLKVDGYAAMSSARYVSGYYDERAVDIFFNELKIAKTPADTTSTSKLFYDNVTLPGTEQKFTPLNAAEQSGALMLILSSNASSVTNAIGQFAENQIVADAITNLANRDLLSAEATQNKATVLSINATASELQALIEEVPNQVSTNNKTDAQKALLRLINAIAQGIDPQQASISDFETAQTWLEKAKREIRQ